MKPLSKAALAVPLFFAANGLSPTCFAATAGSDTFPPDETFDEVTAPALPAGWVAAHAGNGDADWTTVTDAYDSAPNAAHMPDSAAISDMSLTSPAFVPAAGEVLTFRHWYDMESFYDGVVLEISIGGGPFQDILDAGGAFESGSYNAVLSTAGDNPLAGRAAWTSDSGGFVAAVVDLPASAAGQPTQLRFRGASDSSGTAPAPNGWWIDSIHLGTLNAPSAGVTPASLSFSIVKDSSAALTQALTLSNAAGSATLTYATTAASGSCTGTPVPWLSVTPRSGSVAGGAGATLSVTVSPAAAAMDPGSYSAEVCITGNDPAQALIDVPVSLTVTPAPTPPVCSAADKVFCDGFDGLGDGTVVTGVIDQLVQADDTGSAFDFALGSFHPYSPSVTTDDINLYTEQHGFISVYWYADKVPPAAAGRTGGVVAAAGATEFAVLRSGATIGPDSPLSSASGEADMAAYDAGVDGYLGVAFYNETTQAVNYGYLHVQTAVGGFPVRLVDYGYDRSGAAITIP